MKIWDKGYALDDAVEEFTVGNDHILDMKLISYDCIASKAHATMLNAIGILNDDELRMLTKGLDRIIDLVEKGEFSISREDEDCHAAIERYLIETCGDVGEKIHTGRSRNDQVLTAIRLYEKDALTNIEDHSAALVDALQSIVARVGDVEIPGYTHMQKAMPTTIGMWVGSFVDALADRTKLVKAVRMLIDQSPLGTAAGFGVPVINIDRKKTADLMGFARVQDNPLYAQLSRGSFEAEIVNLCSQVMFILNRLATDIMVYAMVEFGFIKLPQEICTGSSIMPHKVNPDVLELVRAKYHAVTANEFMIKSTTANLMSGYNRDVQITKRPLIDAIETSLGSLAIMVPLVRRLEIDKAACEKAMTQELRSTERAYELVQKGMPFRQAYRKIAEEFVK